LFRSVVRKSASILSLILVLSGCSDQPGDVGMGLLTAQDTLHLETRVFNATSAANFLTRINGNAGRVLVGTYQDLAANALVEYSGIPKFHSGSTLDSATVTLTIDYRFKDTTGEFGISAHNMIRPWGTGSFRWDSIPGSYDNALAGSYLKSIAASDTSSTVTFHIDTALVRTWSQTGAGSLLLMPSLTAQIILGFSNTGTALSDRRPLLTINSRDSAGTPDTLRIRAPRSIFVANSTIPALAQRTFVQAGVDYPALFRFDSLALPPKVSVVEASLEFAIDEGASFLNRYSRDSLLAYLTRKDVYPYDSLILGVICSPQRIGVQKYYKANVRNIVQQWISREPNHGLAIHSYGEASTLDRFAIYGADAAPNLRPKLTVSYTLFP
jgi:hypothetical protein